MIEKHEALQSLVESCPELSIEVQEHFAEYGDELPYAAAGAIATRLLALHQQGDVASLQAAAAAIEHLLVRGTPCVQEFATVGLLEGIQNVWASGGADPEKFGQYLQPESTRRWEGLNSSWSGHTPAAEGEA